MAKAGIYMSFKRWLYRGGHPHTLAKILNRGWAFIHARGIAPNYMVALDVVGRKSGKIISFPLAMTVFDGRRYLVSMLGKEANWVQNVRAANGRATLRHGITEEIWLAEVAVEDRAPILKAFLQHAPGARPHVPVHKDAPVTEFEAIAAKYPIFRVVKLETTEEQSEV